MAGVNNLSYSNPQQTEEILLYQLAFEKLLGSIFTRFLYAEDGELDNAIQETLQEIGSFVNADRAYLFMFSDFKQLMSNTHEWCAEGISPQKDSLQNLPLGEYGWFMNELASHDYLYIPLVEEMPESAQAEKNALTRQQIQSILHVPLIINKKLSGFLGFDAVIEPRQWSEEDINILSIVAKIFVYAKERKRSQKSIRIATQLLDSIGEGIFIIRHPDTITWVNQAFSKITGFSHEELLSKQHQFLNLVARDAILLEEMHVQLMQQGNWHGIVRGIHKDGHIYPASLSINATWDQHEQMTSHLVVFQDLTDHQKLIEEREKLQIQTLTAQKLNSLSTMSAGVVHEIAQPLNSIRVLVDGMLYCHQNNYYLPEFEIFEKISEVSAEIKRIDEIIQHMRSFASLNQSAELSSCSWNDAIDRSLSLLGRQLAAHEILVSTILQEDLPPTCANPNRLDEILLNLLVNAMHALDLTPKNDKEIICRTVSADNYTILEIADNGTGIDENYIDMIFDPFFTSKATGQGMGLGLSIVESIMNSLNGQIKVYNNEKGGATFRLELPIIKKMLG